MNVLYKRRDAIRAVGSGVVILAASWGLWLALGAGPFWMVPLVWWSLVPISLIGSGAKDLVLVHTRFKEEMRRARASMNRDLPVLDAERAAQDSVALMRKAGMTDAEIEHLVDRRFAQESRRMEDILRDEDDGSVKHP